MILVLIVRAIDVPVRKLFSSLVLLLCGPADVLYNSSSHLLAASSPGPCLPSSKDSILREFELEFLDIFFWNKVSNQFFSDILIIGQFLVRSTTSLALHC